jgi:hypothetical protein
MRNVSFRYLLIALTAITASFCSDHNNNQESDRSQGSDSIPYFAGQLVLPLNIDSAFIVRQDTAQPLAYSALRSMKAEFATIENEKQLQYYINDFCKIDSMRSLGQYSKYTEGLDIGMMQNATAYRLGNIRLKDKTDLLLWRLNFSSYEACPNYSGIFVVGSLRRGDTYIHLPLGKLYQAGDPPSFMSETLTSQLTNDWIAINTITTSDEDIDSPGEKKETRCYTVQIKEVSADSAVAISSPNGR